MIGIKDQCFGVEIELTGITRAEAAEALGAYFGTTPQRSYDNYDIPTMPKPHASAARSKNGAKASARIVPVRAESIFSFGKTSMGCI